jgi:hypothetical protein
MNWIGSQIDFNKNFLAPTLLSHCQGQRRHIDARLIGMFFIIAGNLKILPVALLVK